MCSCDNLGRGSFLSIAKNVACPISALKRPFEADFEERYRLKCEKSAEFDPFSPFRTIFHLTPIWESLISARISELNC